MSSLIAAMLNSANDHQTKPNMKYIKNEIYQNEIYQKWNISKMKYIKYFKGQLKHRPCNA